MKFRLPLILAAAGVLFSASWAHAWTAHTIDPAQTGAGIVTTVTHDGEPKMHQAYFEETIPQNGRLLITIGGTNSIPFDMNAFGTTGTLLGYRVLGVDYPNSVVTTDCRGKDEQCFDRFRREIVLGEPVSELVDVDRANSLENRIEKLLSFIAREHAAEGWGEFVNAASGKPRWDRIVVAGHSQGSGHAAFLSKRHAVAGVILLAGPQDGDTWGVAPWVRAPGLTPPGRYVGLLHAQDSFGPKFQLAGMQTLTRAREKPASYDGARVHGDAPTILAEQHEDNPHMSVIGAAYIPAWRRLFERITPIESAAAK